MDACQQMTLGFPADGKPLFPDGIQHCLPRCQYIMPCGSHGDLWAFETDLTGSAEGAHVQVTPVELCAPGIFPL